MPRQITAAISDSATSGFSLAELELAEPAADEVVVEVRGMGLCHTDIAAREGFFGLPYPMVLGHEGSGVVVEVGSNVKDIAIGDHVAMSFSSCGSCAPCSNDDPAYCLQFGALNYGSGRREDGSSPLNRGETAVTGSFFGQSSFATYALANERNVVVVDKDVPLEIVGTLGCGLQTGAGAIFISLNCQEGESVLVSGCGPVGMAAVMAAKVRGCKHIIVSEPDARRRQLATELGATATLNPSLDTGTLSEQIRAIVPNGVDYIFDSTGLPAVLAHSLEALAPKGTLGFVGVPHDLAATLTLPILPAMVAGWTIRGITEGDSNPKTFIPELLGLFREGRFPFDKLITTYPFNQIETAVQAQLAGEATKVVLVNRAPLTSEEGLPA